MGEAKRRKNLDATFGFVPRLKANTKINYSPDFGSMFAQKYGKHSVFMDLENPAHSWVEICTSTGVGFRCSPLCDSFWETSLPVFGYAYANRLDHMTAFGSCSIFNQDEENPREVRLEKFFLTIGLFAKSPSDVLRRFKTGIQSKFYVRADKSYKEKATGNKIIPLWESMPNGKEGSAWEPMPHKKGLSKWDTSAVYALSLT
jgi:hypothetical protein